MSKALIISLNFHPGHVSHMVASYKQMADIGYDSEYCVDEAFVFYLPEGSRVCLYGKEPLTNVSVAVFVFPSQKNLILIRKLKKQGAKILYIFHEPMAPMKEYRRAGFSYKYLAKLWVINQISRLTVKWSDAVLLPSMKAVKYYNENPLYTNKNAHYIPLLYDDERTKQNSDAPRSYFSYIGTVAPDHSFKEYLLFVEWAISNNRLPHLRFLVATKSEFEIPRLFIESPRVQIQKGRPLSDAEINDAYASSFVVWNAYERTTQSGVLAKSFMFGTPAIVMRKNLSEFTEDDQEVVAINDNTSYEEIENAVQRITENFDHYSVCARRRFENSFFYRQYNEAIKKILLSL